MLTRLCPRLSDISVYSRVCVDIKYSQFFVFSSLCNHSHYFQRKGPYKRICDFKADWCWRVVFCQSFTLFLFDQTILFVFIVVWSQSFPQDEIARSRKLKRGRNMWNRSGNTTDNLCFRYRFRDVFSRFRCCVYNGTGPLLRKHNGNMELHVSATFPFTDSCNFVLCSPIL